MEARELDALVSDRLFHRPVTWRVCATDPDCGNWEDIQAHSPDIKPGDDVWGRTAEMQPCYNWLDTDEPAAHGWAEADIQNDEYREERYKVVPFYSTDIAAAWLVVEQMRGDYMLDLQDHITYWLAAFVRVRDGKYKFVDAPTAPLAICLAALKAVKRNEEE